MRFQDILNNDFNMMLEMKISDIERKSNKKVFNKISKATDMNDHNGAMVLGLKMLGNSPKIKTMISDMEDIIRKHGKAGHMSPELMNSRSSIHKDMMSLAKRTLGDEFKEFNGAF